MDQFQLWEIMLDCVYGRLRARNTGMVEFYQTCLPCGAPDLKTGNPGSLVYMLLASLCFNNTLPDTI